MSPEPVETQSRFLALRDRAYAFVAAHQPVAEDALLAHTYGGRPPVVLHAQLRAPLLADPRLQRLANGTWAIVSSQANLEASGLTVLALAVTSSSPTRGRVVRVSAEHLFNGQTLERFTATVNPGVRVPGYVAERLGMAPTILDDLPPFPTILDELVQFLGPRPVAAQDARLTWAFVDAEARRADRVLIEPALVDANALATRLLDLRGKPSLALVAAKLGIGTVRIGRPEEEVRVLGQVLTRLLAIADQHGWSTRDAVIENPSPLGQAPLRREQTSKSLPEEPGVYVMRDTDQTALYVGKARRLRSRVAAYVNRPLGATRRLEGLVGSVEAVDSTVCATDLEALILEAREIHRLQPRFNTVRQQRPPRVWIRLPPVPAARSGSRQLAPRRLEPSLGPRSADGEFVGPFRNEMLAERTRRLVRQVFDLDSLRHGDLLAYEERLALAWQFLTRRSEASTLAAETFARQRSNDLLKDILDFDIESQLLSADPREARYAIVRPGPLGIIEGFLVERGILLGWSLVRDDDLSQFAADLLDQADPRTTPADTDIVLRWMGAQRPPASLVHLPDDPLEAADAIENAGSALADWLREP